MTSDQVSGFVRTLLAFGGGILVSKGWIDDATMMGIVGGLTAVVAGLWSWWSKKPEAPAA